MPDEPQDWSVVQVSKKNSVITFADGKSKALALLIIESWADTTFDSFALPTSQRKPIFDALLSALANAQETSK